MKKGVIIALLLVSIFLISGIAGCKKAGEGVIGQTETAQEGRTYSQANLIRECDKFVTPEGLISQKQACLAIVQKNPLLCEDSSLMPQQYIMDYQDYCYSEYASTFGDRSLCEKFIGFSEKDKDSKKERCYLKTAQTIEDCSLISNEDYLEDCYLRLAFIKKDASICTFIKDKKAYCYRNVALLTRNAALCKESNSLDCYFYIAALTGDITFCENASVLDESTCNYTAAIKALNPALCMGREFCEKEIQAFIEKDITKCTTDHCKYELFIVTKKPFDVSKEGFVLATRYGFDMRDFDLCGADVDCRLNLIKLNAGGEIDLALLIWEGFEREIYFLKYQSLHQEP